MSVPVALVHDYLTQRGGAERVVLSMVKAFPRAPLYTSLYEREGTFPEFASVDIHPLALDRLAQLRRRHRAALPLLAPAFSWLRVSADVTVCSSSGWAHGAKVTGRKVVYCYAPARWLYDTRGYLGDNHRRASPVTGPLFSALRQWDRRAALTADRYLTSSSAVRQRIRDIYGIEAEVLPPPITIDTRGEQEVVSGCQAGFVLAVSRLLPYKNVDALVAAFADLPKERLVVVGAGPELRPLRAAALGNVNLVGSVTDEQLRWLYANCRLLVAPSYEDYGLTPLEAAAFGKPSAVLRYGGYLDTMVEDETAIFFDEPEPHAISAAIRKALDRSWGAEVLTAHADRFSEERFISRLQEVVAEEAALLRRSG